MERISDNIPAGITMDMDNNESPNISESSSNDGYFSTNGNTSYTRIGLIVVILLFLGVNIFSYLGNYNLKKDYSVKGFVFYLQIQMQE